MLRHQDVNTFLVDIGTSNPDVQAGVNVTLPYTKQSWLVYAAVQIEILDIDDPNFPIYDIPGSGRIGNGFASGGIFPERLSPAPANSQVAAFTTESPFRSVLRCNRTISLSFNLRYGIVLPSQYQITAFFTLTFEEER